MALKDIFSGLFKKKEAVRFAALTSDQDIEKLSKGLQDLRIKSENKDLLLDEIEELRSALDEVAPAIERVLSGIGENLLGTELIAIDNQIKADQEEAIQDPRQVKLQGFIDMIKEEKLTAKDIHKAYLEIDIVDMGKLLKLETDSKLPKLENAEILFKGINS